MENPNPGCGLIVIAVIIIAIIGCITLLTAPDNIITSFLDWRIAANNAIAAQHNAATVTVPAQEHGSTERMLIIAKSLERGENSFLAFLMGVLVGAGGLVLYSKRNFT